ncbi:MAG TPA: diguanylate cyclase [Anaerolineales bacterium]|nr:diguanylate cyclase [Anaerolineales bacterium]
MSQKNRFKKPVQTASNSKLKKTRGAKIKASLKARKVFELLFEDHPIPMWVYDTKSLMILAVNASAVERYGYSRAEFRKMTIKDIGVPDDLDCLTKQLKKTAGNYTGEWQHRTKMGQRIQVELTAHALRSNNHTAVLMMAQDISERKKAEEESRSLARFPAENPNPVLRATYAGKIVYANAASQPLLEDWGCQVGDDLPSYLKEVINELIGNSGARKTINVRCKGTIYSMMITPVAGGNYVNLYGSDISESKRMEERLVQLSRAVEQSPASIVITDLDGKIEYVNSRFSQVTGYSFEEALGQNPRILKSNETPLQTYQDLWRTLSTGGEWHGEFINRKKNGELYFEFAMISPIASPDGVVTHYLAVKEDITERKHAEEELKRTNLKLETQMKEIQALQADLYEQAIRDYLTGLYNRRFLNESLERELARARREAYPLSFVMIDIDQFKSINDNFGHEIGDKLLQNLGWQLNEDMRASDIPCRYGGDECLVILPNTPSESALQIAERWRANFEASNIIPAIKITISLGIAAFPLHGSTSMEILAAADYALYQAKLEGRNRVVVWHE